MKSTVVFLLAAAALGSACSSAPKEARKAPDRGIFELLALHVQRCMRLSLDCSAGGAVVLEDGKLIYEEYFGRTDRRPDARPVDAQSRFPFFSVSKGFGAAVLASLAADGSLELDDPVSKYLSYFSGPGPGGKFPRDKVTVRTLASHSSGLPPDSRPPRVWTDTPPFGDVTLNFEPGTEFLYTELAMRLLGQVLKTAGGKPYADLLKERVTGPLGLTSVGFLRRGETTENVVATCVGLDSSYIHYSDEYSVEPYPGSGLYGNLRDIARYGQLWLDRGKCGDKVVFDAAYVDQAWRTQPPQRKPDPDYGLLFWLFPQVDAAVFSGMAHTICVMLPKENLVLVMGLNQHEDGRGWDFQTEKLNLARIGRALGERRQIQRP